MKSKQLRRLTAGIEDIFAAPPPVKAQAVRLVELCFDGGCSTDNRRYGYGSYTFCIDGVKSGHERIEYGEGCTSNVAEWESLRRGIEAVIAACDPATTRLEVRGDSRLVVDGAAGRWKVKAPHLLPIAADVKILLGRFASFDLQWWSRENSVRIFGH